MLVGCYRNNNSKFSSRKLDVKMKNNNIKTVDFGIAFKINDQIYVHKNLKKYPKLYKALIKHEKEHSDNFNLRDIWLDLKGKHLGKVKKQYYKFLLREKKAWYQLLPIMRVEKKWVIDTVMLGFWILILLEIFILIDFINNIILK